MDIQQTELPVTDLSTVVNNMTPCLLASVVEVHVLVMPW